MKRIKTLVVAALVAAFAPLAFALNVQSSVTPGVWCSDMYKAIEYAEANHMPLFAFYGVTGCAYCNKAQSMMEGADFKAWQAKRKIVMLYLHEEAWSDNDKWEFASMNWRVDAFPACRIYWPKDDGTTVDAAFLGRQGHTGAKGAIFYQEFINAIEKYIGSWSAAPAVTTLSFETTSAIAPEGSSDTKVSITRKGGTAAVQATVTADAKSGIKIVAGGKKVDSVTLTWRANDSGTKTLTVAAPYDAKISASVVGQLTLSAVESTEAVPVEVKNATFTLTATDSFLDSLGSWAKDVAVVKGTWSSTDDDLLETTDAGGEFRIKAAKAGTVTVKVDKGDAAAPADRKIGIGNDLVLWTANSQSDTVKVGLQANQSLRILSLGGAGARCAIKSISFTAFGTPTILTPADKSSFSRDTVAAKKSLLDLSWAAVSGAEKYIVTIGDVEKTVITAAKLNAVDLGAVSLEGEGSETVKWSVKAVKTTALDAGSLASTSSASFTLTSKPVFNANIPAEATVYRKIPGRIDVSATGASGITYSISKGSLPAGMTLNAKTGVISGAPKRISAATSVTVKATSSSGQTETKTIKIAAAKLPASIKGEYTGVEMKDDLGVAGYLLKISSSGKVRVTKDTSSGSSVSAGSITADYSSGKLEYVVSASGLVLKGTPSAGFSNAAVSVVKKTTNVALNSYSTLGVYDASGAVYGYLTAKVTSGSRMRIDGYVGTRRVLSTVKFSAKNRKAFFASNGVSGVLEVVAGKGVGTAPAKIQVGRAVYLTSGGVYSRDLNVSFLKGYVLACGDKSVTAKATSTKVTVATPNAANATLSWKRSKGLFTGKFGNVSYRAALAKVDGVWMGFGVTTSGKAVILVEPSK